MEKLKISVIVPVYKAEAYLDRCVQSIVEQTYQNMEIFLVEDGSPDRCPELCDRWAKRDGRIRVIHQANAGGAQARNAALELAEGDLLAFVDSDDYLDRNMYRYLAALLEQGYDIAECAYQTVWDSDAVFSQPPEELTACTARQAMEEHIEDTHFRQLIWNKLYRRKVSDQIRFPRGKSIDDEFFTYKLLGNADRLIRSNQVFYAYRQQNESVMHSMPISKRLQALEAKLERHTYLLEKFPDLAPKSLRNFRFTALYQGQLALRELPAREARETLQHIRKLTKTLPRTEGSRASFTAAEKVWIGLADLSPTLCCWVRNALKIGI